MITCTTGSVRLYSTLVAKLQEKRPLRNNIKINFDLVGLLYTILMMTTVPKSISCFQYQILKVCAVIFEV